MKCFVLIVLMMSHWAMAEMVHTNCKLPKDSPIYVAEKPNKEEGVTEVLASFVSQKPILSYTQGNWLKKVYLVTYKVIEADSDKQLEELRFIARDAFATKEIGIRRKKRHWPFRNEIPRVFHLRIDPKVKHESYFDILWHDLTMIPAQE